MVLERSAAGLASATAETTGQFGARRGVLASKTAIHAVGFSGLQWASVDWQLVRTVRHH